MGNGSSKIDQPSILRQLTNQIFSDWINLAKHWNERRVILKYPKIIINLPDEKVKTLPLTFAIRGMIVVTFLLSFILWFSENFLKLPNNLIDSEIKKVEIEVNTEGNKFLGSSIGYNPAEIQLKQLKLEKNITNFLNKWRSVLFAISLVIGVYIFRGLFYKDFSKFPLTKYSENAYLYYLTSRLFWIYFLLPIFDFSFDIYCRLSNQSYYLYQILNYFSLLIFSLLNLLVLRSSSKEIAKIFNFPERPNRKNKEPGWENVANRLVISAILTNICFYVFYYILAQFYLANL